MYKHIDNDAEILDFITDIDIRFTDFTSDRVSSFYYGKDYNLLLFFSKDGDKGFHLFTVENFKDNLVDLQLLNKFLFNLLNDTKKDIFKEAVQQVETHIISVQAVQMFGSKK